jgi:hypothetical protein
MGKREGSLPHYLLACCCLRREGTWPLPQSFYGFLLRTSFHESPSNYIAKTKHHNRNDNKNKTYDTATVVFETGFRLKLYMFLIIRRIVSLASTDTVSNIVPMHSA